MNHEEHKKRRQTGRKHWKWNPFKSNLFTVCFAFLAAIIIWFYLSAQGTGTASQSFEVKDVPIELVYSEAATNGRLHIYNQNELNADVTVNATSVVKNSLTADDITVTGTFSPNSLKTSGTNLMTATVTLKATKNNSLKDYEIKGTTPSEITVEYDRHDTKTIDISKDKIQYSVKTGYVVGTISLSESEIEISGPESSIKQISGAAVKLELTDLSEDTTVTEALTLYGQDEKELSADTLSNLYITLNQDEVEVTIPVKAKKTVKLEALPIGMPDGFSKSRITVNPESIDIAVASDEIDTIGDTITLDQAIYFQDISFDNNTFTREIPLPSNVTNLYEIETATVTINLNGFKETTLDITDIQLINKPSDNVEATTQSLKVKIIGSESQVSKLTSDSVYITVDLSNQTADSGVKTLSAKVHFKDADTCWAVGDDYEVTVNLSAVSAEESTETD